MARTAPVAFVSGGSVLVQVRSYAGHAYQLQRSTSLAPGSWENIGSPTPGSGGILTLIDSAGLSGGRGFYRVVTLQ